MPLERKRKDSEHESAISQLRKTRTEPSSSRTSTRHPSPVNRTIAKSRKAALRERSRKNDEHGARELPHLESPTEPMTEQQADNDNSFATLATDIDVDGNRIYERLPGGRLRVELSGEADCIVAGRCTLWVKHGSVAVLGAILRASPDLHRISAPTILSLPAIRAISSEAEFELGEIPLLGGQDAARVSHFFKSLPPIGEMSSVLSYQVLGLDFSLDAAVLRRPRILRLGVEHFRHLSAPVSSREQCIVFGGNRASESATMARCMLNRLITIQRQGTGVLFVDLGSDMPVLAAPGMISLVVLRSPIFGPSFDRMCHQKVETIRQHFVGPSSMELQPNSWFCACLKSIISTLSAYREHHPRAPVLIKIGSTARLDDTLVEYLWKALPPSSVYCMESPTVAPTMTRFATLAKDGGIPFRSIPSIFENPHASRLHDLNTQSYFHTLQDSTGSTTIQNFGRDVDFAEICFRYGRPGADLLAITSVDTDMPRSKMHQAVAGLLAAVVLVDLSATTVSEELIRRCPTSRVPILPPLTSLKLETSQLVCFGLCYVISIDAATGRVTTRSPINPERVQNALKMGRGILLVLQPPTREGTFAALKT